MVALCTLLAAFIIDCLVVEARFTRVAYSVPVVITAAHHTVACSGAQKVKQVS